MSELLEVALIEAGATLDLREPFNPVRGGGMTLVSPDDLRLDKFVSVLSELLTEHAAEYPARAFRLRVAVHVGEVHHDQQGPCGADVDLTLRMLDAPVLIKRHRKGPLELMISDDIYRSVMRQGYDARTFEPHTYFDTVARPHTGWVQVHEMDGQYGRNENGAHADRTA